MSSYYMKESTYRHDFNKQQQEGNRMAPQERGYDYRQDGPYTDRGGYQYHDRYPDGSQTDRPGYNRFDDRRNGPDRRYDDMNGPSDRGYDRAPQTDRGNYNDRYERNDRSFSPERQRNDRSFSPERNRYNNPPSTYDPVQAYDRFGNRTTQRDYGHFAHNERAPVDRPHAFRGQVDKEVESFHNKQTDKSSGFYKRSKENEGGKMAEAHRTYDSRLRFLENNIVDQKGNLEKVETKNVNHSAKLKNLETQLKEIKAENDAMFDEMVYLKHDGMRSRMEEQFKQRERRDSERINQYNRDSIDYQLSPRSENLRHDYKQNQKYEGNTSPRRNSQNVDWDIPESNRLHGYYRFKAIPYRRQMLLNDNYDKVIPPRSIYSRDIFNNQLIDRNQRIYEPHRGANSFREPMTQRDSNSFREPMTHRDANSFREPMTHRDAHSFREPMTNRDAKPFPEPMTNENLNKQSEPEILEDDDHYIDEMYLRPEERKVRHRNMEYDYDAQQRLPQAIAPQREYISNINRPGRSESGAYLFIRANKNACDQIKLSFQKHKSILKMSGLLKGIARPDRISVTGDFSNWNITGPLVRRGESWYETKGGSKSGEYGTDCIIIVLWFPSVDAAKKWYIYDIDFKIASFPEPHGVEMVILPINYLPSNDIDCNTFVMMEYPGVVNKSALKTYVKDPVEEILTKDRQYEGCEPFVVWTEDPTLGRGQIVSSRSVVAIHRFRSLAQAMEFLNDPRVGRLSRELKDITRGGRSTTSVFQLVDFV